ncbi:MAG: hypothetical protein Q7R80_01160 [bacterium]|nr:hypothetical protein [bacterium]
MGIGLLGWLLLASLIAISCAYFKSQRSELWGLKGVGTALALFVAFWWVLPIVWGLVKFAFWLAVLALIGLAVYAAFRVLSKPKSA